MFDGCQDALKSRTCCTLFGSYGWGDGEWMRNWEDSCKEAGANLDATAMICQEEQMVKLQKHAKHWVLH